MRMGRPSMSWIWVGRRGPRREVEAGATNPMEMCTKDIVSLSATFPMMWNGKLWKTWWKKRVRCRTRDRLIHLRQKFASSVVILFDHYSSEVLGNHLVFSGSELILWGSFMKQVFGWKFFCQIRTSADLHKSCEPGCNTYISLNHLHVRVQWRWYIKQVCLYEKSVAWVHGWNNKKP